MPKTLVFLLACLAALAAGCSISHSIGSISDSVGSISGSSSPKDGIGKDKVPYRDDIANLTYSIAGSSLGAQEFPTAVGRIAMQHNISDWRHEKATYYGIGKGLKKAGVPQTDIDKQPFLQEVLLSDKNAQRYIQDGYKY
ncbi:hypothetical protein SAMN02949497_4104 [Methylomagnum ishizawai]|uniref:Lipoprotein n=1 Tax=Methylomagnum ishizawai TaxID=1760988 RepID=A0A1Y6D194_9GAMM|nr:putative lipoprotein [Methylomagnum ishizawai]SMF96698.1 hypothetical protein SAMN02949497_4104 [Methylomagnum ishizawai]